MMGGMTLQALFITITIASSAIDHAAFGFQAPPKLAAYGNSGIRSDPTASRRVPRQPRHSSINNGHKISTKLDMVRNIDLPEALVFYGIESVMTMQKVVDSSGWGDGMACVIRPGVARLLNECHEVGTAALLLIEDDDDEDAVKSVF